MLVVRIELWPSGDPGHAEEIARMAIVNISRLSDVSDYVVAAVSQRGGESTCLVRRHRRTAPGAVWQLIARAARGAARARPPVPADNSGTAAQVLEAMFDDGSPRIISDTEAFFLAQLPDD